MWESNSYAFIKDLDVCLFVRFAIWKCTCGKKQYNKSTANYWVRSFFDSMVLKFNELRMVEKMCDFKQVIPFKE